MTKSHTYDGYRLVKDTSLVADAYADLQRGIVFCLGNSNGQYLWAHLEGERLRYAVSETNKQRPELSRERACVSKQDLEEVILDELFDLALFLPKLPVAPESFPHGDETFTLDGEGSFPG